MDTETLIVLLYVLVLASFIGFELIAKVPPTLHTPLMSGSNAISGITIVWGHCGRWPRCRRFLYSKNPGTNCSDFCHDKRCRRLRGYRQNVENV